MTEKTCHDCEWFLPKDERSLHPFCRRFPPGPVHHKIDSDGKIGIHFSFAVVSGDIACGEHKPKEPTP